MHLSPTLRTSSEQKPLGTRWTRTASRIGGIIVCGILVTAAWGGADSAPANTGLRGIVPNEVPDGLGAGIEALPENWKPWGTALGEELASLYSDSELDIAGQVKLLDALQARLKTLDKSVADPRYRSIYDALVTLKSGLSRRLDVLRATLETLQLDPDTARAAELKSATAQVVDSAKALEAHLKPIPNSAGWVKYYQLDKVIGDVSGAKPEATEALQGVQNRYKDKSKLDKKAQDFLAAPEFGAFERAVDAYLALATRKAEPVNQDELRSQLKTLLANLEAYEASSLSSAEQAVRDSFKAVQKSAADGGAKISRALQDNYFNYNLQVYASEALLNRLVSERHDESGGVVDYVLGANVYGNQVTRTVAGINLLPSPRGAKFAITLNGTVNSSTSGTTDQATIYTQGYHTFVAQKDIQFDGNRFRTFPATINVNASNTTTGAQVNMRVPLFQNYANGVAMREAEARRPQSEAIAASRVSDRVVPKLNAEVDKEFAQANVDLKKKVIDPLKELHLYPDAIIYRTTAQQLSVSSRLMGSGKLAGSKAIPAPITQNGMSILMHQSLANNSLDELGVAGKTMNEDEVLALIEEKASKLAGKPVKIAKAPKPEQADDDKAPKALIFADKDPIRIRFVGGQVILTLRAGFKREGKDDIPQQIVTVPLNVEIKGNDVILTRGDVAIEAAAPPANVAEQVALAGVVRKKIESSLPERKLSRQLRLKRKSGKVDTSITQVKAIDGWLSIVLQ